MKNNKLIKIQEMLMREMDRLDNDDLMGKCGKEEVARSNALSQSACTFLKSVNVSLRIMEQSEKNNKTINELNNNLGITDEK